MRSEYKKILINSIYNSLINTQKRRASTITRDELTEDEKQFVKEIYPYAVLALQCVFCEDIEFADVVKFEFSYDDTFALKVISQNNDFILGDFDKIRPLYNYGNSFGCAEPNRRAYSIFLINVMALYDVGYKKYDIKQILFKLILLLFGSLCTKRLGSMPNGIGIDKYSKWKMTSLQRNVLKGLDNVLEFVYGTKTISKDLEMTLFESCNMVWQMSNKKESLDFCFDLARQGYGYIDVTKFLKALSSKNYKEEKILLPIIKNEEPTPNNEWNELGYYSILLNAYSESRYYTIMDDAKIKMELQDMPATLDFLKQEAMILNKI